MTSLIESISHGVPSALTEIITLGRTMKSALPMCWFYFDRAGTSNGPTEAINGRLEHLRGSALGFRNLTNYIARSLLETGGFKPRLHPSTVKSLFSGFFPRRLFLYSLSKVRSRRFRSIPPPYPVSPPPEPMTRWHGTMMLDDCGRWTIRPHALGLASRSGGDLTVGAGLAVRDRLQSGPDTTLKLPCRSAPCRRRTQSTIRRSRRRVALRRRRMHRDRLAPVGAVWFVVWSVIRRCISVDLTPAKVSGPTGWE